MVLAAMVGELDTVHTTPRRSLQLLDTLHRVLGDESKTSGGDDEAGDSGAGDAGADDSTQLSWDVADTLLRSVAAHIRRLKGQESDESFDRAESELAAAAVEAQREAIEVCGCGVASTIVHRRESTRRATSH